MLTVYIPALLLIIIQGRYMGAKSIAPQTKRVQKHQKLINLIIRDRYQEYAGSINLNKHIEGYWKEVLLSRNWQNLKQLLLASCQIDDEYCIFIASMSWPNLQILDLSDNVIGPQGVKSLMNNQWSSLTSINLRNNYIKDIGVKYIIQKLGPKLQQLYIDFAQVTTKSIKTIIENQVNNLKVLSLNGVPIGKKGVLLLTKINMVYLQSLYIYNQQSNGVSTAAVKHLTKGYWPQLSVMNISMEIRFLHENKIQLNATIDLSLNYWKSIKIFWLNNFNAFGVLSLVTVDWKQMGINNFNGLHSSLNQPWKKEMINLMSKKWLV